METKSYDEKHLIFVENYVRIHQVNGYLMENFDSLWENYVRLH